MVESGFSRIPVYDGSPDNMVGVVYIKDALRLLEKHQPVVLRKILHPVHFVPETKKVGELLKELQKRRTHLALVIDEHGSLVGLVTLEDLLEEIVGEIQDEYDWEERPVEKLRDGSLVVDGTVSAAELRAELRDPDPGVGGLRHGGRLHARLPGRGPARRGSRPGRGLAPDRGRRRAQPHQQGEDRPRPGRRQGLGGGDSRQSKVEGPPATFDLRRLTVDCPIVDGTAVTASATARVAGSARRAAAPTVRGGGVTSGGIAGHLEDQRRGLASHRERTQVLFRQRRPPDDVRGQRHHDVGLRPLVVVAREEPAQERAGWRSPGGR